MYAILINTPLKMNINDKTNITIDIIADVNKNLISCNVFTPFVSKQANYIILGIICKVYLAL